MVRVLKYRGFDIKKTRSIIRLSFLFFGLFFIVSCKEKSLKDSTRLIGQQKVDTVKNEYAKAFRIIYHPNKVQIEILNPESQEVVKNYWIRNENTSQGNSFPHKIKRAVTFSSTQVGMLERLQLTNKIVGVSNYRYLCHPLDQSRVKEVGDIQNANLEKIVALHPSIIFYSGFVKNNPAIEKMKDAHLKPFLIYEWKETTPLGRAEWIKVYGALFNKQQEANALFHKIKQKYLTIKEKLSRAKTHPSVLSGTYYNGVFNAPAGDSYMAKLFKDANANYVYSSSKGTGSLSLPLEKVILQNKHTKYWLNASASTARQVLQQNQKMRLLGAFKNREMYSYFMKKNCFWANSPAEPGKVLEDMGKILHPKLFSDHTLSFYEKMK